MVDGATLKLRFPGRAAIRRQLFVYVKIALLSVGLATSGALSGCQAPTPGQATAPSIVRRAVSEGELTVYANTDMGAPVLAGFERRFPGIKVRYQEMTSRQIEDLVIAEAGGATPTMDVAWSSSMDVQVKLINDGYAQTYRSPEARHLPRWAVWRNQGFGVTAEPIGFAYNPRFLSPAEAPKSHAELLAALRADPERWRGKIALYDPEQSAVGFLYLSADIQKYPDAWELMEAIARSRPVLHVPGAKIMQGLASGEYLLAFNMNQSYAHSWADRNGGQVVHLTPTDYHLTVSRVAFVNRGAPHPNAARVFLDYLMSDEGQAKLREGRLTPVRDEVAGAPIPGAVPIRVGPALLANLDQARRAQVLAEWRAIIAGAPSDGAQPR